MKPPLTFSFSFNQQTDTVTDSNLMVGDRGQKAMSIDKIPSILNTKRKYRNTLRKVENSNNNLKDLIKNSTFEHPRLIMTSRDVVSKNFTGMSSEEELVKRSNKVVANFKGKDAYYNYKRGDSDLVNVDYEPTNLDKASTRYILKKAAQARCSYQDFEKLIMKLNLAFYKTQAKIYSQMKGRSSDNMKIPPTKIVPVVRVNDHSFEMTKEKLILIPTQPKSRSKSPSISEGLSFRKTFSRLGGKDANATDEMAQTKTFPDLFDDQLKIMHLNPENKEQYNKDEITPISTQETPKEISKVAETKENFPTPPFEKCPFSKERSSSMFRLHKYSNNENIKERINKLLHLSALKSAESPTKKAKIETNISFNKMPATNKQTTPKMPLLRDITPETGRGAQTERLKNKPLANPPHIPKNDQISQKIDTSAFSGKKMSERINIDEHLIPLMRNISTSNQNAGAKRNIINLIKTINTNNEKH